MSAPLATTKIFIPPPPSEIVPRPVLLERLNQGLHSKLIVISAPAGFGKTTLLSEWVANTNENAAEDRPRFAWLSLDIEDNSPKQFWSYVVAALCTLRPELSGCMERIIGAPSSPIKAIMNRVISEILDCSLNILLILDDYHVIKSQTIHENLSYLIDHLPPQSHLAISGRADPPLPLARYRAYGELTDLRTADLRFTKAETTTLLNETMNLKLSMDDLAILESRTEGWIASLRMALISLQGQSDRKTFIKNFGGTNRYIFDFLTEEVLRQQKPTVRSFLLQTSILARLNASLSEAVTGRSDSQEVLKYLASHNLFIVSLDENQQWFRYHQLFVDLLRSRLAETHGDTIQVLHRRACEWFQNRGYVPESIYHALAIPDYDYAVKLMGKAVNTGSDIIRGRFAAPHSWISKFPPEVISSYPWLSIILADIYFAEGKLIEAELMLDKAKSLLVPELANVSKQSSSIDSRVYHQIDAFRGAFICLKGKPEEAISLWEKLIHNLSDEENHTRCRLLVHLGFAHRMIGNLDTATGYFEESIYLSRKNEIPFTQLIAMSFLAEVQLAKGHLAESAATSQQVIQLGTEYGGGDPLVATAQAHMYYAEALYQWNDIEAAIAHVAKAIELTQGIAEINIAMTMCSGITPMTFVCRMPPDIVESLRQIIKNIFGAGSYAMSDVAESLFARRALLMGDITEAEDWLSTSRLTNAHNLGNLPQVWMEVPYLTLVRTFIIRGDLDGIPEALERLSRKTQSEGRITNLIEIRILQSVAFYAQGRINQAVKSLEHAIHLAEPEGFIRIFIDEGDTIRELLHRLAARGIAGDYVKQLIDTFEGHVVYEGGISGKSAARIAGGDNSKQPDLPLAAALSNRELEVLREMATGARAKEIAERLFVGKGTVDAHTNNIYKKLDAKNRVSALARARELGIL